MDLKVNNINFPTKIYFYTKYNFIDLIMLRFYISFFIGLRKLDQLVLSSNDLDAINANWFVGLTSLHDLKICDNKISDIDEGAFNGLNGLYYIEIFT